MTDFIFSRFIKGYGKDISPACRDACGKLAGLLGIISNVFLFIIKLTAGIVSGSVAITADAVNNLSDAGASVITLIGFKFAEAPADREHPYGHARVEYIAGLSVSFIMTLAGIELLKSSAAKIFSPALTNMGLLPLILLAVSLPIKVWQCLMYRKIGRRINSSALVATSRDSLNDVISTSVVLAGSLIDAIFRIPLDGWLGAAVALFIIYSGIRLIIETSAPLIGTAPEKELVENITEKLLSYDGICGMHDLIVHNYGPGRSFATVHAEVPAERDILESHDIIDNIEREFQNEMGINLVIHLDPTVTGDERIDKLFEQTAAAVKKLYPVSSIHDFRAVFGNTHTNLIFDVMLPFGINESEREIRCKISEAVKEIDSTYNAVITLDKDFYNKFS